MAKRSLHLQAPAGDHAGDRTMADDVYRRIRADIIAGVLPPGAPLKSDRVRTVYAIGISPLREALTRLTGERLVTAIGQRGFRVAPLSVADVMDTAETRILIENEALRLSITKGGIAWETALVAAAHALRRTKLPTGPGPQANAWANVHQAFHAVLISACGSPWLVRLADILFAQAERHRIRAVSYARPMVERNPQIEHDEILEATLERNAKLAVARLTRHHRLSARHVAGVLATSPEEAPILPPDDRRKADTLIGSAEPTDGMAAP